MPETQTPTVNSQITDAVTQTNVTVVGKAPAQSMAMVYQSMAHAASLLMQNSVATQNGMQQINSAIVASACQRIMSLPSQKPAIQRTSLPNPGTPPDQSGIPPSSLIKPPGAPEPPGGEGPPSNEISDDQKKKAIRLAADKAAKAAEAASEASSLYNEGQEKAENILNDARPDESSLEKAKTASSLATQAAKESKKASQASENADKLYSKIFDSIASNPDVDEIKRYMKQLIQEQVKTESARDKVKEYKEQIEDLDSDGF